MGSGFLIQSDILIAPPPLDDIEACPAPPPWEGFIVSGRTTYLNSLMPDATWLAFQGLRIEPASIQNLANTFLSSFSIFNGARTRSTSSTAAGCDPLEWGFSLQSEFPVSECLQGSIVLVAGYNTEILQNSADNSIEIGAAVGAGLGRPCQELEQHNNDEPPLPEDNNLGRRTTLDGSLRCNEVVRSINGVGGRLFEILAGVGVTVTPDPGQNQVLINADLSQLLICIDDEVIEIEEDVP